MAQELTPWPISFCSDSRPSQRAEAPEATITVRVSIHSPSTLRRKGRLEKSASSDGAVHVFGAEVLRLLLHVLHQVRAVDAFREAGKVLHQGGEGKLPAGFMAAHDQRFQIGARGVNGGGIARAAGTDNDNVSHG